jgi:hypothetical protein
MRIAPISELPARSFGCGIAANEPHSDRRWLGISLIIWFVFWLGESPQALLKPVQTTCGRMLFAIIQLATVSERIACALNRLHELVKSRLATKHIGEMWPVGF